ncbi:putative NLR family CARD domain-containing protein 4 [Apostichopus japonicus]|uniref:Putative NLR family CARD domain-containing protein 4 n=1 Tax=Stichopus japonicus TaxID=307972 RepID=A0A2G8JPI0_STIJA|nr:putative NLR family CARD domain-containing protein 4 [Apostichopus japonicus]
MGKCTVHLTFFLVVQVVCASSVVGEGCENKQNLELYQPGIIQCSFEEGFLGVQWFNSTVKETSKIITYVRDVKDGPGFRSGNYDVWLNGSLFVRNVTVEHEGVFIVTHASSESVQVKQYNIQVQLFVKPQLEYPVIEECQDKSKICYMLYENPLELSCSVENVRPRISLIWNQRNSQRDNLLESNMTIISNSEVTFTPRSTVKIHNHSPLLSVLVCSVNENTWILKENETLVILENRSVDISHSPIRHLVELHTTMTLPCNDFNERILVWKRSTDRSEIPEVILIRVQTWKEDFNETCKKDFRLKPDGSLMLPQTELHHQGIYTCVASDYDMDHIQTIDVVIFTYPSPPYIIVEGCDHTQYCVLDVAREGNVTCSVRGIRPEVELQWRTYGNYPDLSLTELERTSTEKGGIFDISLTTNFKILSAPERGITLECFIVGQNSDVFKSSIKAARIDLNVAYDGNMGISSSWTVAVVTTIIAVLLILVLLFICLIVLKYRRNRRKIVEDEEMLPKTETHRTPEEEKFIKELKAKYKILYHSVQPLPYIRDSMYCVDNVYVDSGIERLVGQAHGHKIWKLLESHHELLKKPENCGRQIIEGDPGYGKSTLTLQLAYDWCQKVPDSPLSNVPILIYLRLRQLRGVKSIYQAIQRFILPRDSDLSEDIVESIIKNCSGALVILDGFDEYPDKDDPETDISLILRREMLQEIDVILTTRPFYLPKEFAPHTDRIRLTGFNKDIQDQYIRKAVVQGDEQASRDIILKLQRNPLLGDLCQVPLLFVLFAHMSHKNKDLKTFKSVTSFFRNVIACFHSHLMNKTIEKVTFDSKHDELNKVAFEALSGRNQLIVWDSTSLRKRLGDDFYQQYLKTGIFFEEEDLTDDQFLYKKEVRFYHKLFCEWYAAHYIADYLSQESSTSATTESQSVAELLHCLDPFELHYVYRFACGLNKTASGKIVNYLQDNLQHEKFAMMCMLEQDYKNEKIVDTITKLASTVVHVNGDDSQLHQRSTLQVLEFASAKQITIACLHLTMAFKECDGYTILLQSGLSLCPLVTLEKIHIETEKEGNEPRTISEIQLTNIFRFALRCQSVKELS